MQHILPCPHMPLHKSLDPPLQTYHSAYLRTRVFVAWHNVLPRLETGRANHGLKNDMQKYAKKSDCQSYNHLRNIQNAHSGKGLQRLHVHQHVSTQLLSPCSLGIPGRLSKPLKLKMRGPKCLGWYLWKAILVQSSCSPYNPSTVDMFNRTWWSADRFC